MMNFKGRKKKDHFRILKNRRHSWIGHLIRHREFVLKILEGAISIKRLWEDLDYNT
jgi:hypothetical protein